MLFIADKSYGKPLELEALKLAADDLKKSENMAKYVEVIQKINNRLGPTYTVDRSYVDAVDKRAAQAQERLESELHTYKTNLIKESIRVGHNELGDFFYNRGDLQNAFKCYVRTRDYCATSRHIVSMCLNVIKVSIETGGYMHVQNYVAKAEQTPEVQQDQVVLAKLRAAAGLAFIHNKKYKLAARKFVEVSAELGTSYSDVISPHDVAVYGTLCALATFDRQELKSRVITNIGFREFLELVPEVRELLYDFYNSRYASCLSHLAALQPSLGLDLHLAPHINSLYACIRHSALCWYTAPFISVDLNTMAQAFNTSVSDLEKEVAGLIMDNTIQARIDSHNKVLYARHADVRRSTFTRVLQMGEEYVRESKAALLRANLIQHDFMQRARRGGQAPA